MMVGQGPPYEYFAVDFRAAWRLSKTGDSPKETARLGERAVGVAMGRRGNDVGSPATAPLGYGQQPFIKLTFA